MNKQAKQQASKPLETVPASKVRQWGISAFARHCAKIGVSFDDCYLMIFKREVKQAHSSLI